MRWILLSLLLLPVYGQTADIEGVAFADTLTAGETRLELRGLGLLRWGLVFKVYAGGFYLPPGTDASDWPGELPKALELRYFRAFSAEQFRSSGTSLLEQNLPAERFEALRPALTAFNRLFRDVRPGDRYRIVYQPGHDMRLLLNGADLGGVAGGDFARAYFGLWLGETPISADFRDALLGR